MYCRYSVLNLLRFQEDFGAVWAGGTRALTIEPDQDQDERRQEAGFHSERIVGKIADVLQIWA